MTVTLNSPKINVDWVSFSAKVLSSSKFGLDFDRVKVIHEIGLDKPLQNDEAFYTPSEDGAIDTRTEFPDGNITNFTGQRFKDLQDELKKYSEALKNGDTETMDDLNDLLKSTALLSNKVFKKGTQVLTFEYELAIYPNEEQVFDFALWAPMPTFNLVNGGNVFATVELPGNTAPFSATIIEAEGYIPDNKGNPTQNKVNKALDKNFGLRHIVAWTWRNDPLFKVKYKYN